MLHKSFIALFFSGTSSLILHSSSASAAAEPNERNVQSESTIAKQSSKEVIEMSTIEQFNKYVMPSYGRYDLVLDKGSDVTAEVNKILKDLKADGTLKNLATKYGLQDALVD